MRAYILTLIVQFCSSNRLLLYCSEAELHGYGGIGLINCNCMQQMLVETEALV